MYMVKEEKEVLVKGKDVKRDILSLLNNHGLTDEEKEAILMQVATDITRCDSETEVCAFVFKTSNRDKLHKDKNNRRTTPERTRKIAKSIEDYGCVMAPIVATQDNVIIDGMHRWDAITVNLADKNLPAYYVVDKKATNKDAFTMNQSQSRWNTMDFITAFSAENVNYQRLLNIVNDYKDLSKSTIFSIATRNYHNSCNGLTAKTIKSGRVNIDQKEDLDIRAELDVIRTFKKLPIIQTVKHADRLLCAMSYMIQYEGCSSEKMYRNFGKTVRPINANNFEACIATCVEVYQNGQGNAKQLDVKEICEKYQKRKKEREKLFKEA